ncbi:MAG TPA: DUF1592 domain-containing protein [Marinagarivorans sp.]
MLPNRSFSGLFRVTKLAGMVVSAAALGACVSEPDPGQGSSQDSSSIAVNSSSAPAAVSSVSSAAPVPSSSAPAVVSSSAAQASTIRVLSQDYDRFNEVDQNREGASSGICSEGDVDLVDFNGTCAIGYTAAGEWVEYDVSNVVPGNYDLVLRTSSADAGRTIQVSVDGSPVGSVQTVGNGWESYVDNAIDGVAIRTSNPTIRITFNDGEANVNYFELIPVGGVLPPASSAPVVSSSSSAAVVSSSSVAPPVSSAPVASSSAPSGGVTVDDADDFATIKTQFEAVCGTSCHVPEGEGIFSGLANIDISYALTDSGFPDLVEAIRATMPFNAANGCTDVDNCAVNTAAYMVAVSLETSGGGDPQASSCTSENEISYGLRTVRLLTSNEMSKSLVDIGLIDDGDFEQSYSYVGGSHGKSFYPVNTDQRVTEDTLRKVVSAAENLSLIATEKVQQRYNCGTNCEATFMGIAERMFRRPLTDEERSTYSDIFSEMGDEGLQVALAAAITAPQFLYRSEMGIPVSEAIQRGMDLGTLSSGGSKLSAADRNAYVLDPYETATALAYMYTGSTPDETLMSAAGNNRLNTEAQIASQIDRLIETPRGRQHTANFAANWFLADRVFDATRQDGKFTDDIKADMAREVRELFSEVFYNEDVPFGDLYGGDFTVLNRRLAQYYGVNSGSSGDNDWRVTSTVERGGILTSGAFMVNTGSDAYTRPILRAVKLRELMMCHVVPPPVNISGDPAEQQALAAARVEALNEINELSLQGELTSREFFERQTDSPLCASCHEKIINPLFGLEDFDAYGLPRTTQTGVSDAGKPGLPIDASGTLYGLSSISDSNLITFEGTKDLAKQIADLPAVRSCLAVNSFRWTTGLPLDTKAYSKDESGRIREPVLLSAKQESEYSCVKEQLVSELGPNDDPKALYRKIGTLDLVRLRRSIDDSQLQN